MKDIWGELCEQIPDYFFNQINNDYEFLDINNRKKFMYKDNKGFIIRIDRYSADLDYVIRRQDGEIRKYIISDFIDDLIGHERDKTRVSDDQIENKIKEDLIYISKVYNEQTNIYNDGSHWFDIYKDSKYFEYYPLSDSEYETIKDVL